MQRAWRPGAALWLCLCGFGCGDDGGDDDDDVIDAGDDGGRDGGLDAAVDGGMDGGVESFAALHSSIFATRCGSCHSAEDGGRRAGNLALVPLSAAHAQLLMAASGMRCGDSGLTRVVANNPDASLLFLKVAGTPPCGARMPLAADAAVANYLNAADIARIQRWIQQGAPNN